MANLTFRQGIQTPPSSTTTKGSLLTAPEVDGNLASLNQDIQTRLTRNGDKMAGALDWNTPVTVASSATVNLGATTSNIVTVSGTTTITSFGSALAGVERTVFFSGSLTITYNATSMLLPMGTDITTTAGDVGVFVSTGSGNWYCKSWNHDLIPTSATSNYFRGDKTWTDFGASVRSSLLTGLSTVTNAAIVAGDSVLAALGKLQAQISTKQVSLVSGTNIKTINNTSVLGSGNIQTSLSETAMPANGSRLVGNSRYYINGDSSSGFIFYLPSPTNGMTISFVDMHGNWDSGAWYVGYDTTGGKVMGLTENMLVNRKDYNFTLVYADATGGWRIV